MLLTPQCEAQYKMLKRHMRYIPTLIRLTVLLGVKGSAAGTDLLRSASVIGWSTCLVSLR